MKKLIVFLILFSGSFLFAQIQKNAPWMSNSKFSKTLKNSSKNITLDAISNSAKAYFKTIDTKKKGSGLKPFERWKYHWSFYKKQDGTIAPYSDLWNAWEQKKERKSKQSVIDVSDWKPLGPYTSANIDTKNLKQTGQGRLNVIAVDPSNSNTLYVGAPAGGIWKSIDNGVNWTPLTDHLPQIGVSGIAIHPTNSNIIYIATGDDDSVESYSVGVWKSIDGGITWNATGAMGVPEFPSMNEIYIQSVTNTTETVLVATGAGVFKSTDGGVTWVKKYDGEVLDLKMKPGTPSTWYAATKDIFVRSIDGGETFLPITIPGIGLATGRANIEVSVANPEYVYFLSAKGISDASAFNGLWKSTDSGMTFTKTAESMDIFNTDQAWYDMALTVSSANPNIVYVGTLDIWKSINGGDSFEQLNNWDAYESDSYTHADIHFMRFINGKLYAATDGGIYVSENEGAVFKDLSKNLAIAQFYRISISPKNYRTIAGGTQDNGGFAFNENLWRIYHGGDGMEGIIDPTSENVCYGFSQNGSVLTRSFDNGKTVDFTIDAPTAETSATGEDSGGKWVTPMSANSKGEIFSGYKSVYKLVNKQWVKKTITSFDEDISQLEIDPNNDNNMYVSIANKLYRSIDGGINFVEIAFDKQEDINNIEVSNANSNTVWVVTNTGVYKSGNILSATPTFSSLNSGLPSENKTVIKHHNRSGKNTLYLGTNLGVYTYNDTTTTWTTFDNKLPNVQVRDLDINEEDSKLIAATFGRGIFISDIPVQLPPSDIRVLSVKQLPIGVGCGSNLVTAAVEVKNKGVNVISQVTFTYKFDNAASKSYSWNGMISTNEVKTINLPSETMIFGKHSLQVEANVLNDAYSINNTSLDHFFVNNKSITPTTVNSFEGSNDTFLTDTTNQILWELGTPNKTLLKSAATGTKAYVSKLTGNYPDKTTGYLYSKCYDLSSISNPILEFKMAFDLDDELDYMVMEYSIDSGLNWSILGTATDVNWYNNNATEDSTGFLKLPGKQWTGIGESAHVDGGKNADYRLYSYNLSALTTSKKVVFRFKLVTDSYGNEEGVAIDDFVIKGVLSVNEQEFRDDLVVYPNPSQGVFNVSWKLPGYAKITVYNYLGKKVSQYEINEQKILIDLKSQSVGLYFIKLNIAGRQALKKVVLK